MRSTKPGSVVGCNKYWSRVRGAARRLDGPRLAGRPFCEAVPGCPPPEVPPRHRVGRGAPSSPSLAERMRRGATALLLVGAGLCAVPTAAQAQTLVASDWALKPSALGVGDKFRLIFATSTNVNATSTNIADYNDVVQDLAAAGHSAIQDYSTGFQVVGCTADVDARDNTSTTYTSSDTGVPIYWLNGNKVADDYQDFYDGSWDSEGSAKNESGNGRSLSGGSNRPFTGCGHDGTESKVGVNSRALGASTVRLGAPNHGDSDSGPISSTFSTSNTNSRPMYGLSEVFQVVSNDATLSALAVTDGDGNAVTLNPAFDPAEDTYTASVGNTVSRITFDPTEGNENATVKYFDDDNAELTDADTITDEFDVDLAVGANVVKVQVTAQDGNTMLTYQVTVTRGQVCTAPDLGGRTEVWSATLTVGPLFFDGMNLLGYGYAEGESGTLSGNSFVYNSRTATVTGIESLIGGSLFLEIDAGLDATEDQELIGVVGLPTLESLYFHFCDVVLDIGNADFKQEMTVNWRPRTNELVSKFDWSAVSTLVVVLSKPANSRASGSPSVVGTTAFRSTLTVNPESIADSNGLEDAKYTYQWLRIEDGVEDEIPDAIEETYTLTEADIGKSIKVVATFTDDNDYREMRSSIPVGPVTALTCGKPSLGTRPEVWSATLTVGPLFFDGMNVVGYGYAEGESGTLSGNSFAYNSRRATVTGIESLIGGSLFLEIDAGLDATEDQELIGVVGLPTLESLYFHFCDVVLDIGNADFKQEMTVNWRPSTNELVSKFDWSSATTIVVALSAPHGSNRPARGMPTITGTARVRETLTALTTDISDDDGKPSVFEYQWVRVVGANRTKVGADQRTYTLTDDDLDATIEVEVRFEDDDGNREGPLRSAPTEVVISATAPPAPPKPRVYGASQQSGSTSELEVQWRAPQYWTAHPPVIDSYDVRYRVVNTEQWSDGPQGVTETRTMVTGLTESTKYEVQVRSVNVDGKSAWSRSGKRRTRTAGEPHGGDVRIVDGPTPNEGRLEIFHNNRWGSVCDDRFDRPGNHAPTLACQMMGYTEGEYVSGYGRRLPKSRENPIWLDDVRCEQGSTHWTGSPATRLEQCNHAGWASTTAATARMRAFAAWARAAPLRYSLPSFRKCPSPTTGRSSRSRSRSVKP